MEDSISTEEAVVETSRRKLSLDYLTTKYG